MIDSTKIELNAIPPTIAELQKTNTVLNHKNAMLSNILIIGIMVIGLIIASEITIYLKDEDERKKRKQN
jgi:hypothetical protein